MSNGKGDKPRPKTISLKEWAKRYESIFGKKDKSKKDKNER
jgi:hypothetical protein